MNKFSLSSMGYRMMKHGDHFCQWNKWMTHDKAKRSMDISTLAINRVIFIVWNCYLTNVRFDRSYEGQTWLWLVFNFRKIDFAHIYLCVDYYLTFSLKVVNKTRKLNEFVLVVATEAKQYYSLRYNCDTHEYSGQLTLLNT